MGDPDMGAGDIVLSSQVFQRGFKVITNQKRPFVIARVEQQFSLFSLLLGIRKTRPCQTIALQGPALSSETPFLKTREWGVDYHLDVFLRSASGDLKSTRNHQY
jgi:hypothetical protein